jgi:hypothetical protein
LHLPISLYRQCVQKKSKNREYSWLVLGTTPRDSRPTSVRCATKRPVTRALKVTSRKLWNISWSRDQFLEVTGYVWAAF